MNKNMAEDNNTPKKKVKHGGARPGAGRPSTDSKLYTFRAPGPMAKVIDGQASKTDFIKACIEKAMGGGAETAFGKIGTVYTVTNMEGLHLTFFDLGIKAGFPIPLDNDEKSQDIVFCYFMSPKPATAMPQSVSLDVASSWLVCQIRVDEHYAEHSPRISILQELEGHFTS